MGLYCLLDGFLIGFYWVFTGYNRLMELQPSEPPGSRRRKLREVVGEIERLRAEGYTIRAIHQALIDAGVQVSWSAVQREAARPTKAQEAVRKPAPPSLPLPSESQAGKGRAEKVAESSAAPVKSADLDTYFERHNANPLFNKRKGKQP
jgi:hypothetical protein